MMSDMTAGSEDLKGFPTPEVDAVGIMGVAVDDNLDTCINEAAPDAGGGEKAAVLMKCLCVDFDRNTGGDDMVGEG